MDLRLVVASPGDVQHEREAVPRVVEEINRGIAHQLGHRIEVLTWETEAVPGVGEEDEGAQPVIDSALNIQDCDILVGIFWKRFGTPTRDAASGTEHEIRAAYEASRRRGSRQGSSRPHIMLYFSRKRYSPESPEELQQASKVLDFRQLTAEWGLWWRYNGPSDFERLFRGHLTHWLMRQSAKPARGVPAHEQVTPDSHELQKRSDYISRYHALISESEQEIVIFTSKLHRSDQRRVAGEINKALREARERLVEVRILVADGYDRLPGALELAQELGVAVRFDPGAHYDDINYACFDRTAAIVATRPALPPQAGYQQSFSWVEFRSEALAAALVEDFQRRWTSPETRSVRQYLREVLPGRGPTADVARHLAIPEDQVVNGAKPKRIKIFLIGRPGSGKTTVARAVQDVVKSAGVPAEVKWFSDATYLWRIFSASDRGDQRVEPTDDGGFFIRDDTLYREALENLAERAKRVRAANAVIILEFARHNYAEAFEILARKGVRPDLVVYLDVNLELAIHRNRQRAMADRGGHYVSEREMRDTFGVDDLDKLRRRPDLLGRLLVLAEPREPTKAVNMKAVEILERLKQE
jgi:adenylate kinase family enzyme